MMVARAYATRNISLLFQLVCCMCMYTYHVSMMFVTDGYIHIHHKKHTITLSPAKRRVFAQLHGQKQNVCINISSQTSKDCTNKQTNSESSVILRGQLRHPTGVGDVCTQQKQTVSYMQQFDHAISAKHQWRQVKSHKQTHRCRSRNWSGRRFLQCV